MSDQVRSMWETLVAAASTFALFGAANLGLADFLDGDIFGNTFLVVLVPFMPFVTSVHNAIAVSLLKSKLRGESKQLVSSHGAVEKCVCSSRVEKLKSRLAENVEIHGTIAIMALIPIYIPTSDKQLILNLTSRGYKRVEETKLTELCPLELRPAPANNVHINAINSNIAASSADADLSPKDLESNVMEQPLHPATASDDNDSQIQKSTADEEKQVNLVPQKINSTSSQQLVDEETEVNMLVQGAEEREVLVRLGLAPAYKELKYLRSRNRFQTAVTGFQAGGYMLTVIQRLAQNLGISPVEALVTFMCIIMCLQLLIELYACGHYQRPLRLRLNAHQLHNLSVARPLTATANVYSLPTLRLFFLYALYSSVALLILGLAMYYFLHYLHSHLISSLPAFLFFLAHVVLLFLILLARLLPYDTVSGEVLFNLCAAFYCLPYAGSIILAVVSTIMEWRVFRDANEKAWYAWILPHVSS